MAMALAASYGSFADGRLPDGVEVNARIISGRL